jgi:hypothetical protein
MQGTGIFPALARVVQGAGMAGARWKPRIATIKKSGKRKSGNTRAGNQKGEPNKKGEQGSPLSFKPVSSKPVSSSPGARAERRAPPGLSKLLLLRLLGLLRLLCLLRFLSHSILF